MATSSGRESSGRKRTQARHGVARPARRPASKNLRTPAAAREAGTAGTPPPVGLATPEPGFAARVVAPAPAPPRPSARRAIFLDVENTSRPEHLAHVVDHMAVDRRDCTTELVAVANWKVVSQESARLLAQKGAQLVHSAPSIGVRDWSDLRIAVSAGIWLAAARPGDTIEIVSDDRAFDAVGDVAASLGIGFRRLSYRGLVKEDVSEIAEALPRHEAQSDGRGRRRRRRGGRRRPGAHRLPRPGSHDREPAAAVAPRPARASPEEPTTGRPRAHAPHAAAPAGEPHTAPHDAIVSVVRELVDGSRSQAISIDTLANALKARGFRRPPGSPRLVTRLRRIRQIVVSPTGAITLAEDGGQVPDGEGDAPASPPASPPEALAAPPEPARGRRRRRRRRRGGHRPPVQATPTA